MRVVGDKVISVERSCESSWLLGSCGVWKKRDTSTLSDCHLHSPDCMLVHAGFVNAGVPDPLRFSDCCLMRAILRCESLG